MSEDILQEHINNKIADCHKWFYETYGDRIEGNPTPIKEIEDHKTEDGFEGWWKYSIRDKEGKSKGAFAIQQPFETFPDALKEKYNKDGGLILWSCWSLLL